MRIIGAGMAGLVAASVLRNECDEIIEAQPSLPANHSAVLRFKSSTIGDITNIPFRKVESVKSYIPYRNLIASVMAYSYKTNGSYQLRSIITADGSVSTRYVAPPNFTEQLVSSISCPIRYNTKATKKDIVSYPHPTISTLPMPVLMDILEYDGERPEFNSISGLNIQATIEHCDMFCSLYVPDPQIGPYRISINGDQLIAEVAFHPVRPPYDPKLDRQISDLWLVQAMDAIGMAHCDIRNIKMIEQRLLKITPIPEAARRKFIMWATDKFEVYSLGRFATWRPGLLLDDLVKDIRTITRIIHKGNYDQRKAE